MTDEEKTRIAALIPKIKAQKVEKERLETEKADFAKAYEAKKNGTKAEIQAVVSAYVAKKADEKVKPV